MNKKVKRGKHQTFPDNEILQLLASNPNKSYSLSSLIQLLPKRYDLEKIDQSLSFLEMQKKIMKKNEKFSAYREEAEKKSVQKMIGKIDIARSGAVFVITEDSERDIFISGKPQQGILQGDIVEVTILKNKEGSRPEGRIAKVIEQSSHRFIGTIEVKPNFCFVRVDSEWLRNDIFVLHKHLRGAKDGDKVVVKITKWNPEDKNPTGEIIETLGDLNYNEMTMRSILMGNGFNLNFPKEVEDEAKKIDESISEKEIKKRLDYRDITTFTIDPDDAKDFDDAISVRKLSDEIWEVGVHIADVSHYVVPHTALDKEAIERSTSVYLPDRVCPMLPERLSNHICSLRPNEEKLCFAVIFHFNAKHKMIEFKIAKTVIKSHRRFTYGEAQQVIETGEGDFATEITKIAEIARAMRKERFEEGAIAFETTEIRFKLDENAKPIEVVIKERKEANMMIEDWMLLANKTVAKYMARLKVNELPLPFVYRIHDTPDPTKLATFRSVAQRFGHNLMIFKDPKDTANTLNQLMEKIQGKPEQNVLEQLAIRSMAKAIYTTDNIGHYGLGFAYYSHFTSPIRRYPDILVHRLLFDQLQGIKPTITKEELELICKKNSEMERAASDSERQATKFKQVEYLQDRIGEEFEGIISGMIVKGFWVELKANKCEGFVELQSILPFDTITFDEEKMELKAMPSKRVFKIGDTVKIAVEGTDIEARKIWFKLVE